MSLYAVTKVLGQIWGPPFCPTPAGGTGALPPDLIGTSLVYNESNTAESCDNLDNWNCFCRNKIPICIISLLCFCVFVSASVWFILFFFKLI